MPYNTTAIPPRKEVTGLTLLPLTRVKKIIAQDPDIQICSNNAAFIITLATEMFIQHLATEARNMAKLERKPRRNIQYKDLANTVQHHDHLEFLEDLVPKTTTLRQVKDQAAATRARLRGHAKAVAAAEGTAASIAATKAAAAAAARAAATATAATKSGASPSGGDDGGGADRSNSSALLSEDGDGEAAAGGAEEKTTRVAKGKKHSKAGAGGGGGGGGGRGDGRSASASSTKPASGTLARYGFQSINAPARQILAPKPEGDGDVDMAG